MAINDFSIEYVPGESDLVLFDLDDLARIGRVRWMDGTLHVQVGSTHEQFTGPSAMADFLAFMRRTRGYETGEYSRGVLVGYVGAHQQLVQHVNPE